MSDKFLRYEKEQLRNSIGVEVSWGWSPAVDFAQLLEGHLKKRAAAPSQPNEHSGNDTGAAATAGQGAGSSSGVPPAAMTQSPAPASQDDDDIDAMIRALEARKAASSSTGAGAGGDDTAAAPPISVLLAGASDVRHILRTLATLRTQKEAAPEVHFYIYEPNLRTHCRHLFFLQWLIDSMFSFEELEERVLMFLEVFGNSLVREITAAQSRNVSQKLLKGIEKGSGNLMTLVDFDAMKMKERDFLENQLIHWAKETSRAGIEEQWERRLKQDMADRYDNRDNIIDWDFVFHLTDYTNLLKFPEYRTWRNTGIAYDVCLINPRKGFTYSYTIPNKTLCHFSRGGEGVYCGEVKNGPFFALGATTENKHICHRTADGTCKYGNGVVAMHNIRAWLFTLMTGEAWPWADHAFAWDDPSNYNYLPPGTPSGVEYKATFPRVKFHFIGLDFERFLLHRKGDERFDAAFFGTSCTHLMTPDFFKKAMHTDGVVVAETAKFVVDAVDEAKQAFVARIRELGVAAGWHENAKLTAQLHHGQPEPLKREGTATEAHMQSARRYLSPFQLALTHGKTDS